MSNGSRFSDDELKEFHQDFQNLEAAFAVHCEKEDEAVIKLTQSLDKLTERTGEMITVWETGQSVIKAGGTLGRFAKWLSGFTVLYLIIQWLASKY